ncbi:uncharacterized protein LOC144152234 [Haemaphysalis longicornis]
MKRSCVLLIFVSVLRHGLVLSAGPNDTIQDVPDSFKILETFKNVVSIANPNNGPVLECLKAYQTFFDPDTGSADYIWVHQTPEDPTTQQTLLHLKPEDGGRVSRTVGDDPTVFHGTYLYTDNTNCVIENPDLGKYRCLMWATSEVKDSVPQHCIDKFVELCGFEVPQYSRDLCPDGEGDY